LVQTAIGDQLAKALLGGTIRDGDTVVIDRPTGAAGLSVTARH
jgi:ATP-dependent Clp protease ATP-binding subunit ClpB